MKHAHILSCLLVSLVSLAGCKRSLDEADVREFVDLADQAARKRFAPDICKLRGENFKMQLSYQSIEDVPPTDMHINRELYCREAGRFARLRQYRLERRSLEIDVADDEKTANVVAEYVETRPYYGDQMMSVTPDDFTEFVVVESRDESVVGIEGGDMVFLNTKVEAEEIETIPKSQLNLPYD